MGLQEEKHSKFVKNPENYSDVDDLERIHRRDFQHHDTNRVFMTVEETANSNLLDDIDN